MVDVIYTLPSLDSYMCHVQGQTTVTAVLLSKTVLLCGTTGTLPAELRLDMSLSVFRKRHVLMT